MQLIKLNELINVDGEYIEERYINPYAICSVEQHDTYCDVEVAFPYGVRMIKVANTIADIQSQYKNC